MGSERSKKLNNLQIAFAAAAASLPVPSAPPSQAQLDAFEAWEGGRYTPKFATVSIDSDGTGTMTGGAVYAWDVDDSKWRLIGLLHGSMTISMTAAIGFEELLVEVGIFGAMAIAGTLTGGINVDVNFTPVSTLE